MRKYTILLIGVLSVFVIFVGNMVWTEYGMVCNNAVAKHLEKYSNLFDENTTHKTYAIHDIGFPFGVHSWNVQECVDYTLEQHMIKDDVK